MDNVRRLILSSAVVVAVLLAAGCTRPPPTSSSIVDLGGAVHPVSGPYTHNALAVFLIHSQTQDERDFLTLDDGLKAGLVKVTEQEQAQVGSLQIDNQSDRPLFLQEGERLQGGRQDRTITASLVVPPHSGAIPLPAFCIEHSRWVEQTSGTHFAVAGSSALAPKGVRGAAKIDHNQGEVWNTVAVQKGNACTALAAPNSNSSCNEMLDSPQLQAIAGEYADALGAVLAEHPDAVGLAIVVNGQFEEANVYPNHGLLRKFGPRLIQSYGVQAALLKDQVKDAAGLAAADVAQLLKTDGPAEPQRDEALDAHNTFRVSELGDNRFQCATCYDGGLVHWQMMKKNGVSAGGAQTAAQNARCATLGSDW